MADLMVAGAFSAIVPCMVLGLVAASVAATVKICTARINERLDKLIELQAELNQHIVSRRKA